MAARRSSGVTWTSTVRWVWRATGLLEVAGEADAAERPARRGGEEIAVRGADVVGRGHAAPAPQHVLVDHELAVVLADGPRRRAEAGVGAVGARRPLPHVPVEGGVGTRSGVQDARVEQVPGR